MRRNLLLILFVLTASIGFGQLTVEPDTLFFEADTSNHDAVAHFSVTNSGNETAEFYWVLDILDAPSEWEFQVCDDNLCYLYGRLSCSCANPNFLDAGATSDNFSLHFNSNGVIGQASVAYRLVSVCNGDTTTNVTVLPATLSSQGTSSNTDIEELSDIIIYPNPSAELFRIKNDSEIKKIEIKSIIGKHIRSESHYKGQAHYINELPYGFYVVSMMDENNNIKKVIRITKE